MVGLFFSAIPQHWKHIIKTQTKIITQKKKIDIILNIGKVPKCVYEKLLNFRVGDLKLLNKRNTDLNCHLTYEDFCKCFEMSYLATISTQIHIFEFQFLHRIIYISCTCIPDPLNISTLLYVKHLFQGLLPVSPVVFLQSLPFFH